MKKHENNYKLDHYGKYIKADLEFDIVDLMKNQNEIIDKLKEVEDWIAIIIENQKRVEYTNSDPAEICLDNVPKKKDLTDEQVIKRCIEIAIENGWYIDNPKEYIQYYNFEIRGDGKIDFTFCINPKGRYNNDDQYEKYYDSLEEIIFDHEWARCFFKDDDYKYMLCCLATSEDRTSFLRNYLKENNL